MGADDASSADMRRPPANPDADPLALDDETLERLLTGELSPAQAPPGYAEVAALLAATAAPPTPDELAGQAAALAELRAATRPRRAVVGFRRATRPPRRRRVGLLAVALVGALAMGGVAAAATGNVPAPLRDAARSILATVDGAEPASPAPPGSRTAPGPTPGSAGQAPAPRARGPPPRPVPGRAPPPPGRRRPRQRGPLQGLPGRPGRRAGQQAGRDRLPEALAELAGGGDKITSYCERLLPGPAEPKEERRRPPATRAKARDPGKGRGTAGQHRRRRPGAERARHAAARPLTGPAGAALLRSPQPMQGGQMRRSRCRTLVALAPVLIAVLLGACGRAGEGRPAATSQPTDPDRFRAAGEWISTTNPTRGAPATTRAATTTTAARKAAGAGPAGPRLLFGIGPEANVARATPLARQAPVRMLTSWYNGPGDLDWMAGWRTSEVPRAYAAGYSLHLIVYSGDPEGPIGTRYGQACGRPIPSPGASWTTWSGWPVSSPAPPAGSACTSACSPSSRPIPAPTTPGASTRRPPPTTAPSRTATRRPWPSSTGAPPTPASR